jgi:hypothetical protein
MIRIILLLVALMVPIAARADDRRPLPVPSTGGVCPSGYSASPTSGYCVPHLNTRSNAVPKQASRRARSARTRACSRSASKSDVKGRHIG